MRQKTNISVISDKIYHMERYSTKSGKGLAARFNYDVNWKLILGILILGLFVVFALKGGNSALPPVPAQPTNESLKPPGGLSPSEFLNSQCGSFGVGQGELSCEQALDVAVKNSDTRPALKSVNSTKTNWEFVMVYPNSTERTVNVNKLNGQVGYGQ